MLQAVFVPRRRCGLPPVQLRLLPDWRTRAVSLAAWDARPLRAEASDEVSPAAPLTMLVHGGMAKLSCKEKTRFCFADIAQ